eukprot:gene7645-biopygen22557
MRKNTRIPLVPTRHARRLRAQKWWYRFATVDRGRCDISEPAACGSLLEPGPGVCIPMAGITAGPRMGAGSACRQVIEIRSRRQGQGEEDSSAGMARAWRGCRQFLTWGGAGVARACPVPPGFPKMSTSGTDASNASQIYDLRTVEPTGPGIPARTVFSCHWVVFCACPVQ